MYPISFTSKHDLTALFGGVTRGPEFQDIKGTIVDFYCPDYFAGLNVVPYHLHFITEDRKAGGHVLEFIIKDVELLVDYTSELRMILPDTESGKIKPTLFYS